MSSSAGAAAIRSVSAAAVARIDGLDRRPQPLLEAAAQLVDVARLLRAGRRGAGQQHAREAAALQPILVVHRRLVHEVGQRAVGVGGAVPEEDQRRGPRSSAIDA